MREPQARAAADAQDGHRGARAEVKDDETCAGTQDIPVSTARSDDRPGVGGGHYLHSGRAWFFYLVAIMDWASRAVLAWRLSNTMDVSFCVDALKEALTRFGRPEIFNTNGIRPCACRRECVRSNAYRASLQALASRM
jgi:transposase InsO family protein